MSPKIAFVGWSAPQIAAKGRVLPPVNVIECGPEVLRGRPLEALAGLVIGDRALETLDPRAVGRRLEGWAVEFCLFASRVPDATIELWKTHGFERKFANGDLGDRVTAWIPRPVRPQVEISEVLTEVTVTAEMSDDALGALEALDRTETCRIQDWAEAAGIDRHRLFRVCRGEFEEPPEDILWRWFEAGVRVMRAQGATLDEIAIEYGYSSGGSVQRAFRRRNRRIPRRARVVREVAVPLVEDDLSATA